MAIAHLTSKEVRRNSDLPIYVQIKNSIRERIALSHWAPGEKLPSENELVAQVAVSRMTINRALRELTQEGLLYRVHGLGTFVSSAPRHASLIRLRDIAEEVQNTGKTHRSRILQKRAIDASADIVERMELSHGQSVYHLKVLHFQNDMPIQLENRYVNPEVVPDFLSVDFDRQTATRYLMELFKPDEMEHIVQAISPNKLTGKLLLIADREPCLKLTRRTWKNQQVVTLVTMIYPGSRYDLAARYSTDDFQMK